MEHVRRIAVVGTAGHVDHGKSALIEALTGTHPDRLAEERRRGLTIELGFAWRRLDDGNVASFVDVPGHADFIRNMLAGAGGIALALVVVACDEGPMPQTREHLAILDRLGVRRGIVALTKWDLAVDPEWRQLVTQEVELLLKGTSLAGAPIMPVSVVSGSGLAELTGALTSAVADLPAARDMGAPRLSVDRVFSLPGHGTIVTGTLVDGELSTGSLVAILPGGTHARARSLHVHGDPVEAAPPGCRVAVNLTALEAAHVSRGDVVTLPELYPVSGLWDVSFDLLADAPRPLCHADPVIVFHGAAAIPARVRLVAGRRVEPGGQGWGQIVLSRPRPAAAGDRAILRQPSPGVTLGGLSVLDPSPGGRPPRFTERSRERYESLGSGDPSRVAWEYVRQREPVRPAGLTEVATGLSDNVIRQTTAALRAQGQLALLGGALVTDAGLAALNRAAARTLADYHAVHPTRPGMPKEELRQRLRLSQAVFGPWLAKAVNAGQLLRAGETVALTGHTPTLSASQTDAATALLADFRRRPFLPPSRAEAVAAVGSAVFEALVADGSLVVVHDDVILDRSAYSEMRATVLGLLADRGQVSVAELRDACGTSRKFALAFMSHLDRLRVTRRVGDVRIPGTLGPRA